MALCNQLADDFALALDILKECDPGCDCCTQEVLGIVFPGCPCPTYVNPAHASMITKLDSLRGQYAAYGCPDKVCKCKKPTGGLCLKPPTVEVGHCGDRFD